MNVFTACFMEKIEAFVPGLRFINIFYHQTVATFD